MTAKQPAVKKYVVKLGGEERERLNAPIRKGKGPARQVLKARILLKADASAAGEGWSDSRIGEVLETSLETSIDTIAGTRQGLVEGGIDGALIRKRSPDPAGKRRLGGAAEAKLIALACSPPPQGRARWTLTLPEAAVVERHIVDRASGNTIGRMLKETRSGPACRSNG